MPKPIFGIEKPMVIPWASDKLAEMQKSGEFVAELKLDEDRGFVCTDAAGVPSFYSHRHDTIAKMTGPVFDGVVLPPNSVFDGGHIYLKELNRESRVYLFDVLVLNGEKLRIPFSERTTKLRELIKPTKHLWLSYQVHNFIDQFRDLLNGRFILLETLAAHWQIPMPVLKNLVEGFVIKRLDAKPAFPSSPKLETTASFKLRLNDVLPSQKNWLKGVKK
jgi:hypothetical protein